jgi:hypothetical protein
MSLVQGVNVESFDVGALVSSIHAPKRYGIILAKNDPATDPRMVKVSWLWRPDAPYSFDQKPYSCFMYKNFLEVLS